ncbi:MAG: sugar ABC transporter permease [Propionibacteriaceae bacterium]|jgi:arabinogalactan oligomer/maltooligosaccharide transport system permease protein|nr:sugar ABC transporter permease [Propionibacteriaceae bacterium]
MASSSILATDNTTSRPPVGNPPKTAGSPDPGRTQVRALACLFMGLGHLTRLKDWWRGGFFAAIELIFLATLPWTLPRLAGLITLGGGTCAGGARSCPAYDRVNGGYLMVDGILVLALLLIFVGLYIASVRSAVHQYDLNRAAHTSSHTSSFKSVSNAAFPAIGLVPTVMLIVFFVIVPLVFSALVAFTNYSAPNNLPPNKPIGWTGLSNFADMFTSRASWTSSLGSVFAWTIVWAALATFTCYFGGMIMAVLLNEYKFKITGVLRAVFIIPYAIPGMVSLMLWRNMLNGAFGTVNQTLMQLGLIDESIPWLSDVWLAKFMCVVINLWVGFPYFMMLTTGTMTAISGEVVEAARIDGATRVQVFRHITLPLVLYQTAPLMIMSFAANINNFGAIFFLTAGGPSTAETTTTNAGGTDIMISWIYKLTVNDQYYAKASVLAIMIFLVLAPFAIINFRRTKSFREGDI